MRERRVAETAVSPARAERDPLAFEEDDGAPGSRPQRFDRSPEPGEPAADDGEVAVDLLLQRLAGRRPVVRGEPEGLALGVGERWVEPVYQPRVSSSSSGASAACRETAHRLAEPGGDAGEHLGIPEMRRRLDDCLCHGRGDGS